MSKIDAKNFLNLKGIYKKSSLIQLFIFLAAVSHADRSNKNPKKTFDNSFVTLQNALEASRNFKPHFVFFFNGHSFMTFKKFC